MFRAAFDVVAEFQRADDPPAPGSAKLAAAVGHPGVKPSAVPWTAGLVRQALGVYAAAVGGSGGWLEVATRKALVADRRRAERDGARYARELAGLKERRKRLSGWAAAGALLPDPGRADRVMKYESHLTRGLHATLQELQRMQAARAGTCPPSVAVDMTVDGPGGPGG